MGIEIDTTTPAIPPPAGTVPMLQVIRLPRMREYDPTEPPPDDGPLSSTRLFACFRNHGANFTTIQPYEKPWNPFAGKHPLLNGIDLARALRILTTARDCDIVVAPFESPALLPLLLRGIFRFRPKIVMIDLGLAPGWSIREKILDLVIPRIDGIVALGQTQVDYIHGRWRLKGQATFIPMQVDTEFYRPEPFAANGPVLTVGDDIGRDFATLLAAVEDLDIELVAKTKQPIPERQSMPKIRQISERLDWHAWRRMFAAARFVVVPVANTIHASGVGSLLESMAMGKPIITTDSQGLRDYAIPNETALVVPCGDPAAMREAVIRLNSDDDLCRRLGAGARAFVEAHCSFDAVAGATTTFFRKVLASG